MTRKWTYLETHPWLTFSLDLSRARPPLWVMLGECQSKCEHISGVPIPREVARKLHRVYLAKGVAASAAIEGNTLTEDQVLKRMDGKLDLPPSQDYLGVETDNILEQCNEIAREIAGGNVPEISAERIRSIHRRIWKDLESEPHNPPGEIRRESVGVELARYRGAPARECEHLLKLLCQWLNSGVFKRPEIHGLDLGISYAILRAVMAHLYIAWIHPFGDGNGRAARLLEFQILISSGVPSPAAHLLSNHYNMTRSEYYRRLAHSSRSGGDPIPFIEYAVQGMLDGLREQLSEIRRMQSDVMWREHVFSSFREKITEANKRRRELALALSKVDGPVKKRDMLNLSRRITEYYKDKSDKALTRDLNALKSMGLIRREGGGFVPCKDSIKAFLPLKAAKTDQCRGPL